MSFNTPPSPVYKLDCDVLLYVITLNANMFSDRTALRTTRAASQVCQHWRNLMLATPSLWAKLIDLWHTSARDYEWMNELVRRSGTAPLWIRVEHGDTDRPADTSKPILQYFFDLADANWHRIQKLAIHLHDEPRLHATRWKTLHIPAPELHTFAVLYEWTWRAEGPDEDPITTFFAGHAPKLRRFGLSSYIIHDRAPWLRHLHTMHFDSAYSVDVVLAVLSSTQRLQKIKIHDFNNNDHTSTPLRIASLPHLKRLEYEGEAQLFATLLNHLEIPPDCALCMPVSYMPQSNPEHYMAVINTFTRYVSRYLRSRTPKVICLEYMSDLFIFLKAGAAFPHDLPLNISFPLRHRDTSNPVATILNELEKQELSNVTELRFYATGPLDSSFGTFFSSLTSLETIWTDLEALGYLAALQNNIVPTKLQLSLFPSLKLVKLTEFLHQRYSQCDIFTIDTKVWHTCRQVTDKVEPGICKRQLQLDVAF
ncbi:hypothetical protein HYPSUDRAFT_46483 [Hypholoma sublateritium FD-334 SS-4]|uniref:F-box domain-containing protein n=1 Tax=Hypholoma sublateritium (strain FD-334 SS-4) TaxID=945553 RepID=A0A0D2M2J4_HYPSF|nr:hypothetical protein HYPSUDRAFT_46483 [Hypholoma sublateritium FD-334 SS-4]